MSVVAPLSAQRPNAGADAPGQQEQTKYRYPEFAGWAGERYLKKILRQILPMALYRTWEIFVEHQANGNECYLGVSQLAAIAGRTSRTMQKNLAELQAKQLMVERAERKVVGGSLEAKTFRAVVVKDFANLYALAHEYHEWLNAATYLAPDRALSGLIAQDAHLVAKLRRFDNYRRVLYTQLPGPQPQSREEDRWFTEYRAEAETLDDAVRSAARPHTELQANQKGRKEPAKQVAKDSPKRIIETPKNHHPKGDSGDSVPSLSEKTWKREDGMPEKPNDSAPGGESAYPKPGGDAHREAARETGPHRSVLSGAPPQREPGGGQASRSQIGERCSRPPDHPLARSFVQEISTPFGDLNPKGSLTRVLSILAQADRLPPAEVVRCLVRAYAVARDTRTIRAEHADAGTGRANRMPLFCTMVERFVQARREERWWDYSWQQMEADIAADDRLVLWWHEQQGRYRELTDIQTEGPESAQPLRDVSSPEPGPKKGAIRMSMVLSQRRRRPRLSQSEEERKERAMYARTVMACVSRLAGAMNEPIIGEEHLRCGCPLSHKQVGKRVCARCFPDPMWPEKVQALIHSIGEGRRDGNTLKGTGGEGNEKPFEGSRENHPGHIPTPRRWAERDAAYDCGVRVLEALANYGYSAEMVVRPLEEWYQIVLVDEGGELVLETDEQVQSLIEQVHIVAREAGADASRPHEPRSRAGEPVPKCQSRKGEGSWNS